MEVPNPDRLQVNKTLKSRTAINDEYYDEEFAQSSDEEVDIGELMRSFTTPAYDVCVGNQHYHIIDKDIVCTEYAPDVFAHTR